MSESMKKHSAWLLLFMFAPSVAIAATGASDSQKTSEPGNAAPLSVAPLDHVEYPDDRPEWVGQSVEVNDDATVIVVVSGPSDTEQESLEELRVMQRAAVNAMVARVTGHQDVEQVFPMGDEEIDRQLVARRYSGELLQGDATKYEHAVELHFSKEILELMHAAKNNIEVRHRLAAVGVLAVAGLVSLMGSSAMLGVLLRRKLPG